MHRIIIVTLRRRRRLCTAPRRQQQQYSSYSRPRGQQQELFLRPPAAAAAAADVPYSSSCSFLQRQQHPPAWSSSLSLWSSLSSSSSSSSSGYASRISISSCCDPFISCINKHQMMHQAARGLSSSPSSIVSPSTEQQQQQPQEEAPPIIAFSEEGNATTTTTTTAKSVTTVSDVWKNTTTQLFSLPRNAWAAGDNDDNDNETASTTMAAMQYQNQASQCLQWWARQRPITREAQINVWRLWKRLYFCNQNKSNNESNNNNNNNINKTWSSVVTTDLLNIMLDHWRLGTIMATTDEEEFVHQRRLKMYEYLENNWIPAGLANTRSLALLLSAAMSSSNAAGHHPASSVRVAQDAEQVLQNMLLRKNMLSNLSAAAAALSTTSTPPLSSSSSSSPSNNAAITSSSHNTRNQYIEPNTVVWNIVLGHWAKAAAAAAKATDAASASTAAQRAMDLLQLMKEQHQHQQQGFAADKSSEESAAAAAAPATPNAISYASVMQAVLHGHSQPGPVAEDLFQEMRQTIYIRQQQQHEADGGEHAKTQHCYSHGDDSHDDYKNEDVASSSTMKALEIAHLRRLQAWAKTDLNRAVEILNDMRLAYYSQQNNDGHDGDGDVGNCNREQQQQQQQLAKTVVVAPSSHFYSVVMSALARPQAQSQEQSSRSSSSSSSSSGSTDSSLPSLLPPLEQVTRLLEDLYQLYENSNHDERFLPSSSYIYNPVLTAFTRKQDGTKDGDDAECIAQEAQNLLLSFYHRALQSYESGHATKCFPDQSCFNTVINAWAESLHPERIQHAKALVQLMHEAAVTTGESTPSAANMMQPDAYTYSLLIKARSRDATNRANTEFERRRALHECHDLLDTMWRAYHSQQNVSMKPNHITYCTILYAYSQLSRPRLDDVRRAEALFFKMLDCSTGGTGSSSTEKNTANGSGSSSRGDSNLAPQQAAYESIMSMWARSELPQAAARVAFYFDHLRARSMAAAAGSKTNRPSVGIYKALLSSKKLIGDGEGAEQVLETMMQDALANRQQQQQQRLQVRSHGEKGYAATVAVAPQPNVAMLNTALLAWSTSCGRASAEAMQGSQESRDRNRLQAYTAASRAEVLLRRMEAFATHSASEKHSPSVSYSWEEDCRPNTRSYSYVLECWSKLGSRKGARRAESLLYEMVQKYHASGDRRIRPDINCFTTVMMAWARSGSPEAPERTQLILHELVARSHHSEKNPPNTNDSDSDSSSLWAPNGEAYMALILAWTKSGRPEGPTKALEILNEMARLHEQDPTTFERPGNVHCRAVIVAFAEHGDVENAERLLQRILSEHARDGVVLPDWHCFFAVITAYANCAHSIPDAPERAESILNDMRENAEQYGYLKLNPDYRVYNAVLGIWLASRRPEAFERGLRLLLEMVQRHEKSNDNRNEYEYSKKNFGNSTQQQQPPPPQRRNLEHLLPNEGLFLTLLRILAMSNRSDRADQANNVVQLLQACGIQRPYSRALNIAIQICQARPPST